MNSFAGMRVFVSRPSKKTVARTWWERLFTLPWRPLEQTKETIVPPVIGPDECFRIENGRRYDLHCGERFYEQLKAAALSHNGTRKET